MDARGVIAFCWRTVLSSLILSALFSAASIMVGLTSPLQFPNPLASLCGLILMCLLDAAILGYLVIRSRWSGWRLVLGVFFAFFCVKTFLSQIETLVFLRYLVEIVSAEMLPKFFAQGAVTALLFSPVLVLVHERMRKSEALQGSGGRLIMPKKEWAWKLASIAVIYVITYILFGMLVFRPLAGKAFEEYYAGLQLPWWILPFQAVRGLMWAAIAILVVRMMRGSWWEAGLTTSLLFSVLMSSSLLIPTEIMPESIRIAHFVEIFSSNFLFGWIAVWLLHLRGRIPRQS
ncbi:MAG: hypothetical protein J7L83_03795 [Thaumarchaeota archaeon]|nr:hypothetical protein [Nitrososphaerota archaeon]